MNRAGERAREACGAAGDQGGVLARCRTAKSARSFSNPASRSASCTRSRAFTPAANVPQAAAASQIQKRMCDQPRSRVPGSRTPAAVPVLHRSINPAGRISGSSAPVSRRNISSWLDSQSAAQQLPDTCPKLARSYGYWRAPNRMFCACATIVNSTGLVAPNRRSGAGERREPPIRLSRVVTGGSVPSAGLVIVCAGRRRVWGTVPGDRGTASQALPG
jgi:hypothetical protein